METIDIKGDDLTIMPLGAGNEVGRSCIRLQFKGKTVLFDCGIHPAKNGQLALPWFDTIDLEEIDLLLLTHFHLDHCGALPYLMTKTFFNGTTYMTYPTKAITKLLLSDYVKVANMGNEAAKIYSPHELGRAMDKVKLVDYHQELEHNGIKFIGFNAGHVLGAAMFLVEIAGVRILYTGDYSREEDRHLHPAEVPNFPVDVLIIESTYGVQVHEPRHDRERQFTDTVHNILSRGGRALLPVFALGRAQELLLILDEYWDQHKEIQHIPIYYASSLAKKCITVFQTYINMMGDKVRRQFESGNNPFIFKHISNLKSMDYFDDTNPSVVMASPGMLQNGQSRDLFERWCGDGRNGLVLTGYSVEGTMAKELQNEPSMVQMQDGTMKKRHMTVDYISFSAHADCAQTHNFIEMVKPIYCVLVHGDSNEMNRLKLSLEHKFTTLPIYAPQNSQTVTINFNVQRNSKIVMSSDDVNEGLVIRKDPDHIIVPTEAISTYTSISINKIDQKLKVPYEHSLRVFQFLIKKIFSNTRTILNDTDDKCLQVESCVLIKPSNGYLELSWEASPLSDSIADTIALTAMQIKSNPSPALLSSMAQSDIEDENFQFVVRVFNERFENVEADFDNKMLDIKKEGLSVRVDYEIGIAISENETLRTVVQDILNNVRPL